MCVCMCNREPIIRGTENELLFIHVYKLVLRFLFRFKHHYFVLGKNIDHVSLKE